MYECSEATENTQACLVESGKTEIEVLTSQSSKVERWLKKKDDHEEGTINTLYKSLGAKQSKVRMFWIDWQYFRTNQALYTIDGKEQQQQKEQEQNRQLPPFVVSFWAWIPWCNELWMAERRSAAWTINFWASATALV